jgi:hypothetical protein
VREKKQHGGQHMHFNSAGRGRGRGDLAPVCRKVSRVAKSTPKKAPKKKAAARSQYVRLKYGAGGCPKGREITNRNECSKALKSLKMPVGPVWAGRYGAIPRFCTVRERKAGGGEHMHFNSAGRGRGRGDLAPVCKGRGGAKKAPKKKAKYVRMRYGAAGCRRGKEITNRNECSKALKSLKMPVGPVWAGRYGAIPRFCTIRERKAGGGEHMHFNSARRGRGRGDLAPVCKA